MKRGKLIGLIVGIIAAAVIMALPIEGLSFQGREALALTIMCVVLWSANVMPSGYVACAFIGLALLTGTADAATVFGTWLKSTLWMMMAAFLIAGAVVDSGLAERIAYHATVRIVRGWTSLIMLILLMLIVLGLLSPNTMARCFIVFAIVKSIAEKNNFDDKDLVKLGFIVFALGCPSQSVFLTGEGTLNQLVLSASGITLDWFGWFLACGVPCIIASVVAALLALLLFKPSGPIEIDIEDTREKLESLGALTGVEKKMIIWLVILVAFWMTDSIHGLDITWGTITIVALMALPGIGEVVNAKTWGQIPVNILFFCTGAMAIGSVGDATGMNQWIAQSLLPATLSDNVFLLGLVILAIATVLHMVLGSQLTTFAVVVPLMLTYTSTMNVNPVLVTMLVFTSVSMHFLLPFHALPVTVGMDPGRFSNKECLKFGIPMTVIMFIMEIAIFIPWWMLIGYA